MVKESTAWGDLRSLRSSPPGFAAADPRRRAVFSAALEQSEQLLRGAEQLGYASRPLDLFYGLSQAGRAIAAAWSSPEFSVPGDPDRAWLLSGHGIGMIGSPDGQLEEIRLRDKPTTPLPAQSNKALPAFPAVARVLGSDSLAEPASLVDLWAALPEASERLAPGGASRWRALRVAWDEQETSAIAAWVGPLPDELVKTSPDQPLAPYFARILSALRSHYPSLWRDDDPIELDGHSSEPGRGAVWLKWTSPSLWKASFEDRVAALAYVRRDFESRLSIYRGQRRAIPLVEEQRVHPILIWWAVLYTMSMLARYQPESWASAIDVDNSPWAVPLEHLLDEALAALPEIINEALARPPDIQHPR